MNETVSGWSNGSVVKSTSSYSRETQSPGPGDGTQLFITPVPGYPFFCY